MIRKRVKCRYGDALYLSKDKRIVGTFFPYNATSLPF